MSHFRAATDRMTVGRLRAKAERAGLPGSWVGYLTSQLFYLVDPRLVQEHPSPPARSAATTGSTRSRSTRA